MLKPFAHGLLFFIITFQSFDLIADRSDLSFSAAKSAREKGSVNGRVIQIGSGVPISYASISSDDKNTFARSNSAGEFTLHPDNFPVRLLISKFGFNDEYLTLTGPCDSALVRLTPLNVHKDNMVRGKYLQYESILKRSLEKIRAADDKKQRALIYCRISSFIDTVAQSLFESYAYMNSGRTNLTGYEPAISRYAASNQFAPGLSENNLEFKTQSYINLPMFAEKYIRQAGYADVNGARVAIVSIDLEQAGYTFYIDAADTTVIFVSGSFISERKKNKVGPETAMQNYSRSFSIAFSHSQANDGCFIDWVSDNEEFTLFSKNKSNKHILKQTVFSVVPDNSSITTAVRNTVLNESLTSTIRQLNFSVPVSREADKPGFASETETLMTKPYNSEFWNGNSFIAFRNEEQRQILKWEENNMFYSDKNPDPAVSVINPDSVVSILNNNLVAIENVYIETDRNEYLEGDTIWFSAFVVENLHIDSASLSKILYVELINPDNTPEKRLKLLIRNGRAEGDFILAENSKDGIYHLRAYTQYMRNNQSDYLFEKAIMVHHPDSARIITAIPIINTTPSGDSIDIYIRTTVPDTYFAVEKNLEITSRLNDSITFRKSFTFKKNLKDHMGFFVPSDLFCRSIDIKLTLSGKDIISEQRISIPLKSVINIQFFPESGKMVNGLNSFIAFKATDDFGNPVEFTADIIDENNNIIRQIRGDVTGTGKFSFTPKRNHSYKARIINSGKEYFYNLPLTEPEGYILNFDPASSDLMIKNNMSIVKSRHFLLLSVRGAVHASLETLLDTGTVKIHIPLQLYPKGIIQVTLFDTLFRPLAERLVFNNRPDKKMLIQIKTDKSTYHQREKVNLKLNVTDHAGNPVKTSLVISVTDSTESNGLPYSPDIESYLYFSSELKGQVDSGQMNLSDTTVAGDITRDLVMMAQGWRNYLWNSIRYKNTVNLSYPVEKGFCVTGKVNYSDNRKSDAFYNISYADFKAGYYGNTKTDEKKNFKIEIPFYYNSHNFFIQSTNNKNKIEKVYIALDTLPVPPITFRNNELPYIPRNIDYINALEENYQAADSTDSDLMHITLPEVKVTARKDRSGYSSPDNSIDLDKMDPDATRYNSIFQMIYQEFGEAAFTAKGYGTKGKVYNPILVVNGYPMTSEYCPPCYDWLSYGAAAKIPVSEVSDVKFYEAGSDYSKWVTPNTETVHLTSSGASTVKWKTDATGRTLYMLPPDAPLLLPVVSFRTYSDFYRGNPRGAVIFSFQGLYHAREFYQPNYNIQNNKTPDKRKTIYWDPDLETDSSGTATISFFNSDLKGKALIRISGISYSIKDASSAQYGYISQ